MSDLKPYSRLFQYIETLQADRRWGRILDAGTGVESLRWVSGLEADNWTAITASQVMVDKVLSALGDPRQAGNRILIGNWKDQALLQDECFDTVLADYLVGAIEGFSPYWQDMFFQRLRPLLQTGGRLYVTGLEPYVPFPASTPAGEIVREIGCLRDACLLLAGERPYREFPIQWVIQKLLASGFQIVAAQHFPIIYGERFINAQLDMCLDRLQRLGTDGLGEAMAKHVEALRERALRLCESSDGLRHGADYVIAAELLP